MPQESETLKAIMETKIKVVSVQQLVLSVLHGTQETINPVQSTYESSLQSSVQQLVLSVLHGTQETINPVQSTYESSLQSSVQQLVLSSL